MSHACKICQNAENNQLHAACEMLLGTRERFTYLECGGCGCVQLLEIPADMGKYYPKDYYSFQEHGVLKTLVRRQWSSYAYGRRNILGWLISTVFFHNVAIEAVRYSGVTKDARILDVGCGSGRVLLDLSHLGFRDLTGADPYIQRDIVHENGVKIFKRELSDLAGEFDLITLHYTFEHMDRPAEVMRHLQRLLSPQGVVMLSIPIASSYAWRRFGVNWFNLDAPRHLYIHTYRSIDLLAQNAGLKVADTVQEGDGRMFWLSEEYERGISQNDPRALGMHPLRWLLASKKMRTLSMKAKELNRKGEGDVVRFYLRNRNTPRLGEPASAASG
ncbi:MAG TPA: class I SAM-dependent methyltransferase [Verrucomicrobiae bacterium]